MNVYKDDDRCEIAKWFDFYHMFFDEEADMFTWNEEDELFPYWNMGNPFF